MHVQDISIHAPRVGSDGRGTGVPPTKRRFQSTLPVWGATEDGHGRGGRVIISIHAPRVGSDASPHAAASCSGHISIHAPRVGSDTPRRAPRSPPMHFNPRSPCGERHSGHAAIRLVYQFQSTLPVWGATVVKQFFGDNSKFQSTLPVWGATMMVASLAPHFFVFQATLPVWGATRYARQRTLRMANFNPRSPCGERHQR